MDKLMREEVEERVKKLERLRQTEEEQGDLKKAERMVMDEKKWYREIISKIDIVPEESGYYDKLAVKPGFEFVYAMVNARQHIDMLRILIPDTLYFNFQSYLIYSEQATSKIIIKESPSSKDFLTLIERKAAYDIVRSWTEPATVLRKATTHPCYQSVNLLNWKQTYAHLRNGPANRSMVQRYV